MGKERRQSLNATIHLRNSPFRQRRRGMRRVTVTVGIFAVLTDERSGVVANIMPGGGTESSSSPTRLGAYRLIATILPFVRVRTARTAK